VNAPRVTVPPDEFPVSLDEAKAQIRMFEDDEDALIDRLIAAATDSVELHTGRSLITRTIEVTLPSWTDDKRLDGTLWIPSPPLQDITSIAYVDADGNPQTLSTSVYQIDIYHTPGRVALKSGQSWPVLESGNLVPITITAVAGYGDNPEHVPEVFRHAILLEFAELFEHREQTVLGPNANPVRTVAVTQLLAPFRVEFTF
jgi:uncharacterized phiE125 gp8 family phage protein